jgi:hypothetical protein
MLMAVTPFAPKRPDNVTELFTNIAMVKVRKIIKPVQFWWLFTNLRRCVMHNCNRKTAWCCRHASTSTPATLRPAY